MNHVKALKSLKFVLLDKSILFFIAKPVFPAVRARYAMRSAIRPGFETVSRQQAAHARPYSI